MFRVGGREIDLVSDQTLSLLSSYAEAKEACRAALADPGFRNFLKEAQELYLKSDRPLVLSEKALASFVAALYQLYVGKEPDLTFVQPSLQKAVLEKLLPPPRLAQPLSELEAAVVSFAKEVAQEFLAGIKREGLSKELLSELDRYAETLALACTKAAKNAQLFFQSEEGRIYDSAQDFARDLVLAFHARLGPALLFRLARKDG